MSAPVGSIPGHHMVRVRVGEWEADIDEEIAPLIEEIWKADIDTANSCQENKPGIVWIEFLSADDAASFLNIVAEYEEEIDSLYNRIRHGWDSISGRLSAPFWEYTIHPQDFALQQEVDEEDCVDEWHEGIADFFFSVSIRFPRSDVPTLLERLRRYNGATREPVESQAALDS
jgi:hypothetical protein